jgi:protein downstream neighbor of Son
MGLFPSGGFDTDLGSALPSSSGNMCYSMEIKDAVLPPWVVSGICSAMSFDARSFDLRYSLMHPLQLVLCTTYKTSHFLSCRIATEPLCMGLNAALKSMSMNAQPGAPAPSDCCALLGIPDAVLVPSLHSASVRRLSYTDGEYVAYTTV